ncbi:MULTISPECIES: DUF5069 domain-containing protein [unclassified Lentimonas]|uniref:DUF5069 domain-containing protein n=1 Tax=unclassified Lentimonas TaxID=2630993 RepID=UPI001324379F|nr:MULTISPECIES: DUF5069 domain-containing protein [unclassified Lentimonas]CAA6678849.1 Unannotated [Lentimonas sp. CC4]CAA6684453.1 Unannotated [Lentimonas sp. CC6]CAA6692784.1 Unannotated [Lentimonas sp. CC19]CAA6695040.1 Unannotated [Lentimonas sp. CC10]CAA7069652.1 Unannotated [Lentimonas sp. CC11]
MEHHNYSTRLKAIWDIAIAQYQSGNRKPNTFFDAATLAELASIGLNPMDVYDPVEDHLDGAEIDFTTFLLVSDARRDYFLNSQKGIPSDKVMDRDALPARDSEARGIVWLPRIMPKALAKLRGELPPETMYGCGGDRAFFKPNNIHPAEFLRAVWAYEDEPEKLFDWVEARRAATKSETAS